MKTVVTGAAGFIGSHVTEALAGRGDEVTAIDNFITGRRENVKHFPEEVRFEEADIRDTAKMKDFFKDAEAVFHLAALPSVPRSVADPELSNDINVNGTLSILIAARDAGVRRVVYSSSSSVYGDTPTLPKIENMKPSPLSPYAAQKLMGEYYCLLFNQIYGLETASLRYFNVFGPRQDPSSQYAAVVPKFITLIMQDTPPVIFGDGEQSRDFTYVDNVVACNLLASEKPDAAGNVMNVACGERTTVNELARMIAGILGKDIEPVHEPARQGDVKHSLADITAAREIIGFEPGVDLKQGLEKTAEFFTGKQV